MALAEPHEREAMERDRAAVIHELQVYADRAYTGEEPWALVNSLPATVLLVGEGEPANGPPTYAVDVLPGERAPEKRWIP